MHGVGKNAADAGESVAGRLMHVEPGLDPHLPHQLNPIDCVCGTLAIWFNHEHLLPICQNKACPCECTCSLSEREI